MSTWIIVAVVLALIVVGAAAFLTSRRRRTEQLQGRFGSEYDRTVEETGDRGEAESELRAREKRREQLDIRDLDPSTRERYAGQWREVQADFVDSPESATTRAETLVQDVMRDRGYPVDDFDQRVADISVDHANVADHYRAAREIAQRHARGEASTEDMRQAMVHYRSLFEDLLGASATGAQTTTAGEVDR